VVGDLMIYAGAEGNLEQILYGFCQWEFILISNVDIVPTDMQYDVLLVWKER
jgi:hypothetical protein